MRKHPVMSRVVTSYATVFLASAIACSALNPKLPSVEPGFRREAIREGGSSCSFSNCHHDVRVGGLRMRSEDRVRVVSAKELGASRGERLVMGVLGMAVRGVGASTVEGVITMGTRNLTDSSTSRQLACNIAWIDNEEQKRENGEVIVSRTRVADATDCRLAGADSAQAGTWHFSRGAPTALDSLKRIKDTLGLEAPYGTGSFPTVLELTLPGGERKSYGVVVASTSGRLLRTTTWTFTRPGGAIIGALRLTVPGNCYNGCALDLGEADEQESSILRLLAALLMIPLA